jgi:N-acetylmuramoyl-L-alanine amidase
MVAAHRPQRTQYGVAAQRPEIGSMTDSQEGRLLDDVAYQDKIAQALGDAAARSFREQAG